MTDAPELKPCPFCGGDARVFAPLGFENVRTTECSNCGSTGPWESKEAKAIAGWNTRVPTADTHDPTPTAVDDSPAADSVVNADLVETINKAIGPFTISVLRHENYSGEHREWKEPILLPKNCTDTPQIVKAAITTAAPLIRAQIADNLDAMRRDETNWPQVIARLIREGGV